MSLRLVGLVAILFYCVFNEAVSQEQAIKFTEINIGCLNLNDIDQTVVIRDDSGYQNLRRFLSPHPDCGSYIFPSVDFSSGMLVGYKVGAGGCSDPEFNLKFLKGKDGLIFQVHVRENGWCRMLYTKMFWIVIPKTNDAIKFITESHSGK